MITVIANFHARKGNGDQLAAQIPAHADATRSEPGCLLFSAYRATQDPDDFLFVEKYADRDAFDFHRHSAHFIEHVREGMVPLLERSTVHEYDEVASPAIAGAHTAGTRPSGPGSHSPANRTEDLTYNPRSMT